MNPRITLISALFVGVAINNIYGFTERGASFPPEFSTRITGKFNVILRGCSIKGVEFDVAETQTKVSSCLQQFNELGQQKKEYPDYNYPDNWEDEEQLRAYRADQQVNSGLRVKNFCAQVTSTLQCLSPLKSIFDECESSEGITLFGFLEEACKNDGKPIVDLSYALEPCGKSKNFIPAFEKCAFGEGGNGLSKYIGGGADFYSYVDEICNLLTLARECLQRGIDAEPVECARTSQLLKEFADGAYSRVSNAQAASQCIR